MSAAKLGKQFQMLPLGIATKRWFYRMWEIIPGTVSWLFLLSPVFFSFIWPIGVAYFIIAFDLLWFLKSMRMSFGLLSAYKRLQAFKQVHWQAKLDKLEDVEGSLTEAQKQLQRMPHPTIFDTLLMHNRARAYETQKQEVARLQQLVEHETALLKPSQIHHVVITAMYNESLDVLRPSIEAILNSHYDTKKIIFVLAYEQRGGAQTAQDAKTLEAEFASKFGGYMSVGHPDGIEGELRGKGANISYAGRQVEKYLAERKLDPEHVVVTTFDSDHRPDPKYFGYLTHEYCANPNRTHVSFQPMAMFFNNIWDAPAPMRVIATGNSFWLLMESVRYYRLRNFAAHAQSFKTLVDTDFWSVTTIVEDGHQYWRTFFTYDGDHVVEPLYVPIYQDAVLAHNYRKTFQNQYKQLRRWAYGASDIPFVVTNNLRNHQVPFFKKWQQLGRLMEGHLSWATAPLILGFAAWAPLLLNTEFTRQVLAHQLPVVASRILTIALVGQFITICMSLLMLPPRPKRYHKAKIIFMILQWVLVPVTSICFGSVAALDAQTRLMIGRYPKAFDVTEKAVKK